MDRCGVYCRVSTEQQRDNYSIDRQKNEGKSFCLNKNIDYELYVDVQSGSTIEKRSEFSRLILDIEDKKIDCVWVVEFSRLTRNDEEDSLFIKNLFIEYNIQLFENGIEIKFDSPEDQLFFNIRSSVAAYERRKIRERMSSGLNKMMDNGMRVIPRLYGYRYENGESNVIEYEADVIRFIFKLAAENKTLTAIQKELILKGYKQRTGKVEWKTGNIGKMLRHKAYIGLVRNSKGEYIDSVHYQRIIDSETWERVQEVMDNKTIVRNKVKHRIGTFELSGLLKCRDCGTKYFRKNNTKNGIERGFYIHVMNNKSAIECKPKLKNTSVDEMKLLYLVRAVYLYNFSDYNAIVGFYNSEIERLKRENSLVQNNIDDLNKQVNKLESDKQKLIDAVLNEVFTMDEIKNKKTQIDDQINLLKKRIDEQNQIIGSEKNVQSLLDDFAEEELMDFWDLTQVERKELYLKRIKSITLYNRELDIEFINNITFHFDDVYNLDEQWQNEVDVVRTYYEEK